METFNFPSILVMEIDAKAERGERREVRERERERERERCESAVHFSFSVSMTI